MTMMSGILWSVFVRLLWGSGSLGIRNVSAFEHMKLCPSGWSFYVFGDAYGAVSENAEFTTSQ